MPKLGKNEKRAQATKMLAGIDEQFEPSKTYSVAGVPYTPEEMIAVYRAHLAALDAVDAAQAVFAQAVARERQAHRRAAALTTKLKLLIASERGPSYVVYRAFGWDVPKKPGPKTVAGKASGVKKREARRQARRGAGK